jgi:hypothetical protein
MKRLILLFSLFGLLALNGASQVYINHLFGNITPTDVKVSNDLKTVNTGKSLNAANYTLAYFLRFTAAETAYELPLFKGGGGQFFSATGLGLSIAAYDLSAIEKFSANLILFVPNNNNQINGVSTALTIGVPIPKLNLPNINIGIREDWKAKVTYLQTSITLEF